MEEPVRYDMVPRVTVRDCAIAWTKTQSVTAIMGFVGLKTHLGSKPSPVYFWQRIISPHMAGLASALAQRGHQVTYVAEREMSRERAAQGWKAPDLGLARYQLACDGGMVNRIVQEAPIDSVHICQGLRANGLVQRAQQELRRRHLSYWITMETIDDEGWAGLAKRSVYRYQWLRHRKHLDGILAIGQQTPGWLAQRGFVPDKIYPFAYFLPTKVASSREETSQGRPFRFVYAGRLITLKRVDLLLAAFSGLAGLNAELVMIGDGPLHASLQNQAQQLGIQSVHWMGQLPMPEVQSVLAEADCLILASRHDGWGAVVSESLMVGTPAICSDACGSATAVQASGLGGVFASGDKDDLTRLMRQCFEKGKISREERIRIRTWANALGADAGAQYLAEMLNHAANGGEKPMPPWIRPMPLASTE